MAIDDVKVRLRHRLEEMFGVDEAAILMDRPPGGWSDLVTRDDLDQRLAAQDERFDLKFEALEQKMIVVEHKVMGALHQQMGVLQQELRAQTWRLLTAVIASMSVLTAMFGLIVIVATR